MGVGHGHASRGVEVLLVLLFLMGRLLLMNVVLGMGGRNPVL